MTRGSFQTTVKFLGPSSCTDGAEVGGCCSWCSGASQERAWQGALQAEPLACVGELLAKASGAWATSIWEAGDLRTWNSSIQPEAEGRGGTGGGNTSVEEQGLMMAQV